MTVGQSANLHKFQIPRELLLSCKGAHAKYVAALENEKKFACQNEKAQKRKLILEEISEIKRKKLAVEQCILSLKTGIDKYTVVYKPKRNKTCLF